MKFLVRGRAAVIDKEIALGDDEVSLDWLARNVIGLTYQEHTFTAESAQDALFFAYHRNGDGFWLNDDQYCFFPYEPVATELPPDRENVLAGAPVLPGMEALFARQTAYDQR